MKQEVDIAGERELIIATVKENVSLAVFDAANGERIAAVEVGEKNVSKPHEIAVSKDGTRAFVSLYGDKDYGPNTPENRLGVVDLTEMKLLCHVDLGLYSAPHAMMTDAEGMIWVSVESNRCALVIDPDSWEIKCTIFLEVPGHFLAPSPDCATVYFSANEYPVICEVDVANKQVGARITVPVGAQAIRVSPDGARLYVGDFYRPLLHVVDCASRQLAETVLLTGVPGWPFNSRDGDTVIVTTFNEPAGRGYVELPDSGDLARRRVIELPAEPFHALPMQDGDHVLVALANGDIAKVSLQIATLAPGGFSAGGTMPEMLLHMPR